jgi:tRNA(Arg) A34 adenosine deaminase TadA
MLRWLVPPGDELRVTSQEDDDLYLARAVALSRAQLASNGGGPFGAVIVRDGAILAEGCNEVTSTSDPTAHAEVTAIRRACAAVHSWRLDGATLYTSCEPCPMCLAAAYWARIARIVYANTRDDAARIGFDDAHIYGEVAQAPAERSLPTEHRPREDAREVLAAWLAKPDRVPY